MFRTTYLILMVLGLILFSACNTTSSGQISDNKEPEKIEKSSKRGLAYNLEDPADLDALKYGVSWWYNWYLKTDAPNTYTSTYQMEFIPMLWGWNKEEDFTEMKIFILDHPEIKYLLVLNEPNLTDQANQTPSKAASEWNKYEQLIADLESEDRDIALVGPAMTWGTMSGYSDPITWLDAFYEAYRSANKGQDPRIDYLAFHWYDYGLEGQLDRLQKYGKDIWVTEMANWNAQIDSYEKQAEQMRQMVALCEARDDVFRYAWFIGRGAEDRFTNLFNSRSGDLNDLGELYITLPF